MDNASTELSLASQSVILKEISYHLPVVIFTKDSMDADKPVPVLNLPPMGFICGTTRQGITGSIQVAWDP